MRERINRLARGIVENSVPELVLKPERVEAVIPAGQVIRGELGVVSGNNLHIKGLAYSDDERVKVVTSAFGGLAMVTLACWATIAGRKRKGADAPYNNESEVKQ